MSSELVAGIMVDQRSLNTCFSKKILLLLVWQALFSFSLTGSSIKADALFLKSHKCVLRSQLISPCFLAPFVGWLADVRFGRYRNN